MTTTTICDTQERVLAERLIARGARDALVHYLLVSVGKSEIKKMRQKLFPAASPPAGRLPGNVLGYLRDREGLCIASAALAIYERHHQAAERLVDPAALIGTRDRLGQICPASQHSLLNINCLWLLIAEYRSARVWLDKCKSCHVQRIRHIEWSARSPLHRCPHCAP